MAKYRELRSYLLGEGLHVPSKDGELVLIGNSDTSSIQGFANSRFVGQGYGGRVTVVARCRIAGVVKRSSETVDVYVEQQTVPALCFSRGNYSLDELVSFYEAVAEHQLH